jgi:hypothetical protein
MRHRAPTDCPQLQLFDDQHISQQDAERGFKKVCFKKLRAQGRLVFVCMRPNETFPLDIMREICERFIFVNQGRLSEAASFATLLTDERVRGYLGRLVDDALRPGTAQV